MKWKFLPFFLPLSLFALEMQPWFGDVYEFHLLSGYSYSRYTKVDSAIDQLTSASNDHLLFFDLEFSFSPQWSIDFDLEFTDTPRQSFSYRSSAVQARYLWLDDIIGDVISLATGFSIRNTSSRSLKDVSCPYEGNFDFEANLSFGKEFDTFQFWRYRFWGYGAIGLANRGSPWFRGIASFETNYRDLHKFGAFIIGNHGYGRKDTVNIANFYGYARIREKYLDLAFRYGYRVGVWGTLRLEYKRRVLAKRCPENVNTFMISFLLPFSF